MCSKLQHPNGNNYIVVAGGYYNPKSVELIDLNSDCKDLGEEFCNGLIDRLTCENENVKQLCQSSCYICTPYGK